MKNSPATAAPLHPVVLLARVVGFLIGFLVSQAPGEIPAVWAVFAGLTAYALTLAVLRRDWPTTAPARTRQ